MALRTVAATSPPPSTPSCAPKSPSLPKSVATKPRTQFTPISTLSSSSSSSSSSVALSLFALFTVPPTYDAKAFTIPKDQLISSVTKVENAIDQAQELGSGVLGFSQRVLQVVIDVVKPAVDVALPILRKAGDEALKIASPAVSEASKNAQQALLSSGIDPDPVVSAAKTVAGVAQQTTKVIGEAKPIAASAVETISSSDPVVVVGAAGAVVLTWLLFPSIWSAITYSFRGYKGQLTPAQTLHLMSTQNYLMVDIRSEKEKNKFGVPRLPSKAKNKMILIPLEELPSKLKGMVRNAKIVEAQMAALKISFLKKVNKGSKIVIMDSYSDAAKNVAKALTGLGFKNCWVMEDGFSGRQGWVQSRLEADSYNVSLAEVLSPSRIIPAAVRNIGTTSSTAVQAGQKFLPGGNS